MSTNLSDKVVVITGAAKGIGFEIANQFLQHNAKNVILLDVNVEGEKAASKLNNKYGNDKAVFIKCDVTKDLKEVSRNIFTAYKTIDILINNAGILQESQIAKTVDINVKAVLEWSMTFYEHMRKDKEGKGGMIINMSSIWGYDVLNFAPIYQATKFAICGFTKSLGHIGNYKITGVRVVAICPGFTETDLCIDLKSWDSVFDKEFSEIQKQSVWQKADAVGQAAVEVFFRADSGTIWQIEGGNPVFEV